MARAVGASALRQAASPLRGDASPDRLRGRFGHRTLSVSTALCACGGSPPGAGEAGPPETSPVRRWPTNGWRPMLGLSCATGQDTLTLRHLTPGDLAAGVRAAPGRSGAASVPASSNAAGHVVPPLKTPRCDGTNSPGHVAAAVDEGGAAGGTVQSVPRLPRKGSYRRPSCTGQRPASARLQTLTKSRPSAPSWPGSESQ